MKHKLLNHVLLAFRWAIFGVGLGELLFSLFGVVTYVAFNIVMAIPFVMYVARFDKTISFAGISGRINLVSLTLLVMTVLYDNIVRLEVPLELLLVDIFGVSAFCITAHITALFYKSKHVTQ